MCVRGSRTNNGRRQHAWATCRRRNRPRPGRKTRGLLHVCGVRKLRFDETAPFCTTDELKHNPYGVSGPLGAGARAVTGALDCVFASTDGHATCSNIVRRGVALAAVC